MFGIGFSELVLIGLVVIVFIRPEDLPVFFRKLGRIYREIKKAYDELTKVKDDFIKDFEASIPADEPKISGPETSPAAGPAEAAASGDATSPGETESGTPKPQLNFSKNRPLATEGVPAAPLDDGSAPSAARGETGEAPGNS